MNGLESFEAKIMGSLTNVEKETQCLKAKTSESGREEMAMANSTVDQQSQSQLPMIIALNGPSSSKKREIAASLAEFLHHPLIDEEDITLDLQTSLLTSAIFFEELPFKIVTRIANTQLKLKLHVIINTSSLALEANINRLLTLARGQKARLVVVECTDKGAPSHDYKVGGAPVLSIDISKPFIVKDFVPAITNSMEFYKKAAHEGNTQSLVRNVQIIPPRTFTDDHAHEFSFTPEPKADSDKLLCNYCEKLISGPKYQCTECDEFILHQSCAETYESLEATRKYYPFYLQSSPSEYSFPQQNNCVRCDQFTSKCNSCLLQTHIKSKLLPTIWRYEKHEHPLNFVIMPFWFNYVYKCVACDEFGKSISYKCYGCNLDLHIACAMQRSFEDGEKKTIAMGPWGGQDGFRWDDGVHSTVRQLVIAYGSGIDSIKIEYDRKGTSIWSEKHGGNGGNQTDKVKLDYPDEYLVSVSGYYGSLTQRGPVFVRSLTFQSNKKTYGPFGVEQGTHFSFPTTGGKIVGFHGKSGWFLDAIGVYLKPAQLSFEDGEKKTISVGPWGGQDGFRWDDGVHSTVRQLVIAYGSGIDSIQFEYDVKGTSIWSKKHGGDGGKRIDKVKLDCPDEYLASVSGYYGRLKPWEPVSIRSLTFQSNKKTYGPFGIEQGTYFSFPVDIGIKIVGFHGRSGQFLDAIGLYLRSVQQEKSSKVIVQPRVRKSSLRVAGTDETWPVFLK